MKQFLKKLIILSVFFILLLSTNLLATGAQESDKPVELVFGFTLNEDHIYTQHAYKMAERIKEETDGTVIMKVYPSSQLGDETAMLDGMTTGTVDMVIAQPGVLGKFYPPVLFFDGPFIYKNEEHMIKCLYSDAANKMFEDMVDQIGFRRLGAVYAGQRHLTTKGVKVTSPKEIANLKIRVPDTPVSIAIFRAMGANPVPIAWSELYMALQQGVVQGEENSFGQILSGKFAEVQDYVTLTGHQYSTNSVVISEDKWQMMSEEQKEVVGRIVKEECDNIIAEIIANNNVFKNQLIEDGMEIVNPDLDAFREKVLEGIREYDFWNEDLYQEFQKL